MGQLSAHHCHLLAARPSAFTVSPLMENNLVPLAYVSVEVPKPILGKLVGHLHHQCPDCIKPAEYLALRVDRYQACSIHPHALHQGFDRAWQGTPRVDHLYGWLACT